MAGNGVSLDPPTPTPPPGGLPPDNAESRREERQRRLGRNRQEPEPEPWWLNPQLAMPLFPVDGEEVPVVLDARRPPAFCWLYKVSGGRRIPLRDDAGVKVAIAPDVTREELEDSYGAGRYVLELYPALAADSPGGTVRPLATRRLELVGEERDWPSAAEYGGGGRRPYYDEEPRRGGGLERLAEIVDRNPTLSALLTAIAPPLVERLAGPKEDPTVALEKIRAEREARMAEQAAERETARREEELRHKLEMERAEQRRLDRELEAKAEAARLEQLRLTREEERRAEERAWQKREEAKAAERAEDEKAFQRRLEAQRELRAEEAREYEKREATRREDWERKLEAQREARAEEAKLEAQRETARREAAAAEDRAWQKRMAEANSSGGLNGALKQVEQLGKAAEVLGYSKETGEGMGAAAAAVGSAIQSVGGLMQQHLAETAATERAKLDLERERMRLELQPPEAQPVRATVTHTPAEPAAPPAVGPGEPAPAGLPAEAVPPSPAEAPPAEEPPEESHDEPPGSPPQS